MINKTYVIAGNYHEFIYYSKGKSNQVYIGEVNRLYGLQKPTVICVGTYYKRNDWLEILTELQIRDANTIYES